MNSSEPFFSSRLFNILKINAYAKCIIFYSNSPISNNITENSKEKKKKKQGEQKGITHPSLDQGSSTLLKDS